ncbi:peptidase M48 [Mangrovimicrobium sediminis]|uniref:Peptidase M48 n=1 Tax=Mangrovimicrobium sediminis TaxID=2562682 RepID=A0A4Z0M7S3_9GAMM|nr:M48 family metalloprotease [Haliea sp. SAOS-164]TGD75742.1 peptidase M48 [Haliea sp. SAOS-164]
MGRKFAVVLLLLLAAANAVYGESAGAKAHRQMVEAGQIYDDPELKAYVERVGQRLVAASDDPDGEFTFWVLDSGIINAFAAPGGFIYISRGMLPYLESEEEMAGVLGHEIAHITANHHGRQQRASWAGQAAAIASFIFTGSGDVARSAEIYGAELLSGYGRDMELEADGLGAEFLSRAGYDPQAMLQVLSVLKDQEQFARIKARSSGKPAGTYHGLYASHPRNDKRLHEVIDKARELHSDEYVESPEQPGEFLGHLDGLVWGESIQGQREENRYYHDKLAFSFAHPPGWTVETGSRAIIASSADGASSLTITLRRRTSDGPEQALRDAATGELGEGKALEQAGLQGYTALASSAGVTKRLAVIDYNYSYLFVASAADIAAADAELLAMIESFRPLAPQEKTNPDPHFVHFIQVPRGATMASLASSVDIPYAEEQLRLINGLYPRGEPRVGDWIKMIR